MLLDVRPVESPDEEINLPACQAMVKTLMKEISKKSLEATMTTKVTKKQPKQRTILSVSGEGLDSVVTIKVTAKFIVAILTCLTIVPFALTASPDVTAQFAFALIQLAGFIHRST